MCSYYHEVHLHGWDDWHCAGIAGTIGTTERSELYRPDDSRTATLDLKGRRRPGGGSVPFAENEDDRNLYAGDPNYGYGMDGVSLTNSNHV